MSKQDGSRIREARKRLGMTQGQLAVAISAGRVTINRIERGVQEPTLSIAKQLASALETSLDSLFSDRQIADAYQIAAFVQDAVRAPKPRGSQARFRAWARPTGVSRYQVAFAGVIYVRSSTDAHFMIRHLEECVEVDTKAIREYRERYGRAVA